MPKNGRYGNVQSFAIGTEVEPLAVPTLRLSVDSLFAAVA
jgi:hypothetical protein